MPLPPPHSAPVWQNLTLVPVQLEDMHSRVSVPLPHVTEQSLQGPQSPVEGLGEGDGAVCVVLMPDVVDISPVVVITSPVVVITSPVVDMADVVDMPDVVAMVVVDMVVDVVVDMPEVGGMLVVVGEGEVDGIAVEVMAPVAVMGTTGEGVGEGVGLIHSVVVGGASTGHVQLDVNTA